MARCLLFAAVTLALSTVARAQYYSIVQVGAISGHYTLPSGMNNSGQVVGYSSPYSADSGGGNVAFLASGGATTQLGSLGGNNSYAFGINDSGAVVGGSYDNDGNENAYAYFGGVMVDLGTLGGSFSRAMAINSSGQIAGFSKNLRGQWDAFLFSNGVMTDLGTLGGDGSSAVAINDSGQIVGVGSTAAGQDVAFLYSNGVMQNLGTAGGTASQAAAINNKGQIVGSIVSNNFLQAFVYTTGGMQLLGTLGGDFSQANGINDAGVIVGSSAAAGSTNNLAFVYLNGVMVDLNTLVNQQGPEPGSTLGTALAINNQGQILAEGWDDQAYLLTPSSVAPPTPTPAPTPAPTALPPPVTTPLPDPPTPVPTTSPPTPDPTPVPTPLPTPVPPATPAPKVLTSAAPASAPAAASHVSNISCRAYIGTGSSVAIAGFVISGSANEQVLIRGVGPALAQFSVAGVLAQPVLTVFNSAGAQLATNTGWATNSNSQQVGAASAATGAFALPAASADSALLLTLAPGSYTAEVSGLNGTTGNALIEVYEVPLAQ